VFFVVKYFLTTKNTKFYAKNYCFPDLSPCPLPTREGETPSLVGRVGEGLFIVL